MLSTLWNLHEGMFFEFPPEADPAMAGQIPPLAQKIKTFVFREGFYFFQNYENDFTHKMYYTYILQSEKNLQYYTGFTKQLLTLLYLMFYGNKQSKS